MSCEQKDEQFTLRFLDCDCTCCGVRQRSMPSVTCMNESSQFQRLVKEISKPRYGLDCHCQCGGNASTRTTPIQVNFSVDTGIKPVSDASTTGGH